MSEIKSVNNVLVGKPLPDTLLLTKQDFMANRLYVNSLTPPKTRLNYFVYGEEDDVDDPFYRELRKELFPRVKRFNMTCFVNDHKEPLKYYHGQPIIIWNDYTGKELLRTLGKDNFLNIFDPHPEKMYYPTAFGDTQLMNTVNIVYSSESYADFIRGLSKNYREGDRIFPSPVRREIIQRFPFLVYLDDDNYDVFVNKSILKRS